MHVSGYLRETSTAPQARLLLVEDGLNCYDDLRRGGHDRGALICVLGGIASGFRSRRRTIIVAMAAMALLPTDASDAGRLVQTGKSPPRHGKPPKHVGSPKRHTVRLAALGPVALPSGLKPSATMCDPAKFRIVLDVGHTAESEGAISARNVAEYVFNLRLAQRIEEKLKAEGFAATRLLLTGGRARPSLFKRVAAANNLQADLLLSIHHDSVPTRSSRIGNSRARRGISATVSAAIPSSSPATIRSSRQASCSPNWSARK